MVWYFTAKHNFVKTIWVLPEYFLIHDISSFLRGIISLGFKVFLFLLNNKYILILFYILLI